MNTDYFIYAPLIYAGILLDLVAFKLLTDKNDGQSKQPNG